MDFKLIRYINKNYGWVQMNFYGLLLLFVIVSGNIIAAGLTGNKTVGVGKDYSTISAAISALNSQGVGTGGVTFLVDADYVETISDINGLIITATGTAANQIKFVKNGTGANPIITTEYNTQIFTIITIKGGDYITFDGIDIIENESNTDGKVNYGIKIIPNITDGACYNTIKNCTISLKTDLANSHAIFQISDNYNNGKNDYNTFSNIYIPSSREPIYIDGYDDTSRSENCIIENCTIGDETNYNIYIAGITLQHCNNITVNNNVIRNVYSSGSNAYGILFKDAPSNTYTLNIYNNKIYNINTYDFNYVSIGISITNYNNSSNYCYIYNNMISNLIKTNSSTTSTILIKGIEISGGSTNNYIYHNSILINSTQYPSSRCISLEGGKNNLYNNLFITTSNGISGSNRYGIYAANATNLVNSDYNNFYFSSLTNTYIGRINTTNYATLTNWISGTSKDNNSQLEQVYFNDNNNLHLSGASEGNVNLSGKDLTSLNLPNFNKDIDGEDRYTAKPYMGADELTGTPLPIELQLFEACVQKNNVTLTWQTVTEISNYGFFVERAKINDNEIPKFVTIGFVNGMGNVNIVTEYVFVDDAIKYGKYAYRLKQVDNNGKYTYSNILKVEINSLDDYHLYQNYPNPFNSSTNICFNIPVASKVTLKIYDSIGKEVAVLVDEYKQKGIFNVQFDATNLASGVYFYKLQAENYISTKKLLLLK